MSRRTGLGEDVERTIRRSEEGDSRVPQGNSCFKVDGKRFWVRLIAWRRARNLLSGHLPAPDSSPVDRSFRYFFCNFSI